MALCDTIVVMVQAMVAEIREKNELQMLKIAFQQFLLLFSLFIQLYIKIEQ